MSLECKVVQRPFARIIGRRGSRGRIIIRRVDLDALLSMRPEVTEQSLAEAREIVGLFELEHGRPPDTLGRAWGERKGLDGFGQEDRRKPMVTAAGCAS